MHFNGDAVGNLVARLGEKYIRHTTMINLQDKQVFKWKECRDLIREIRGEQKFISKKLITRKLIPYLNKFWAVVTSTEDVRSIHIVTKEWNKAKQRIVVHTQERLRFNNLHSNKQVKVHPGKKARGKQSDQQDQYKYKALTKIWYEHKDRGEIECVEFNPHPKDHPMASGEGQLNTYTGFLYNDKQLDMYEAQPGDEEALQFYLNHVKRILCNNVPLHYEYVLQWMAAKIQEPWTKLTSSIVFICGEGGGKGSGIQPYLNLFGKYGNHVTDVERLCSQFNGLLSEKLVIFVDELSKWNASSSIGSKIKTLITEQDVVVEKKFQEARQQSSYVDFIFATNSNRPIRQDGKTRRWFLCETSNELMQRPYETQARQYFNKLAQLTRQPGFQMKLHLYLRDKVDVDRDFLREPPYTPILQTTIIEDMQPLQYYFYASLEAGRFLMAAHGGWPSTLSLDDVYEAYKKFTSVMSRARKQKKATLHHELKRCLPVEVSLTQPGSRMVYDYQFQSLEQSRQYYTQITGIRFDARFNEQDQMPLIEKTIQVSNCCPTTVQEHKEPHEESMNPVQQPPPPLLQQVSTVDCNTSKTSPYLIHIPSRQEPYYEWSGVQEKPPLPNNQELHLKSSCKMPRYQLMRYSSRVNQFI